MCTWLQGPHWLLLTLFIAAGAARAEDRAASEWVRIGDDEKLVYKTTERGDRIMDFSHAGYMGGGVALPDVPTKVVLHPSGGDDDTAMIQAAIDQVSNLPLVNGFRGAIVLAPATIFPCAGTIRISASGVVLRGAPITNGPRATLKLTGRPHGAISVGAARSRGSASGTTVPQDDFAEVQTSITDAYVPSGATSFTVAKAHGLAVGDWISIRRPVTESWVHFMQMDDMTRDGRQQTWIRTGTTTNSERQIAAIDGNKITVEVPLADSFDAQYLNPPGTSVVKIRPPGAVSQVGIENLRIESPPQEISHTQPHFTAMRVNGTDCWVRDVEVFETMNSIGIGGRRITFQNVSVTRKARHQGASKPAEFAPNGTQVLLDRCSVSGDNVWFIATGAGVSGPVVILNCSFHGNGRAESHQRWSTGMLYDNCRAPDGGIELRNRGSMGSGHGWSMGWGVVWNCIAHEYIVQNPPGSMNWLIGSVGESQLSPRPFGSGPMLPQGTLDSHGKAVAPSSLYLAQLRERLGPQALKNIGYDTADINGELQGAASQPRAAASPHLNQALGPDLALHRPALASNARGGKREFNAWQALDGDDRTYWATDDGKVPASIELDTEGALDINAIELGEAIDMTGRVRQYKVEGFRNSRWETLSQGATIGESKVDRFPKVTVWKVRLTILKSESYPAIRKFAMYLTEK
jgi:hypothetical protein